LIVGTAHQLRAATSTVSSVTVVDVNLPLANEMKVLGVILDRHLTFENHVSAVARSCNYHIQAICHIRNLLSTQLAQTLACSLILSRLDYCNAVLHGIPCGNIQKLQRVQNSAQSTTRFLLERLQTEFGVEGTPLTWLWSYLDGRTQYGLNYSLSISICTVYYMDIVYRLDIVYMQCDCHCFLPRDAL